ncbi:complex III assembly factor LYRM7-like [Diadema setosum]|uniref:complex III assembly factor LYRM7-like n=1 Tax=Diadema setosum TaxID=31175 RepID=UPI003B3BD967
MRSQVLSLYKSLQRTAQTTFQGDTRALQAARVRIRDEFKKNATESDTKALQKLLKIGEDVKVLLEKAVAQGVLNEDGRYALRIHEHLLREDNAPLPPKNKEDKR